MKVRIIFGAKKRTAGGEKSGGVQTRGNARKQADDRPNTRSKNKPKPPSPPSPAPKKKPKPKPKPKPKSKRNDESDNESSSSSDGDNPPFHMACKIVDADRDEDDSPCEMSKAEARAWVDAFCGVQDWDFRVAWRAANETLAGNATVQAKLRAALDLPRDYGDPMRVCDDSTPFEEGDDEDDRMVYDLEKERVYKELKRGGKSPKTLDLDRLQTRRLPTRDALRERMVMYVHTYLGMVHSYMWSTRDSNRDSARYRNVWCRGSIVGVYFDAKTQRFGGLVLFRHFDLCYKPSDRASHNTLHPAELLVIPDLDVGFPPHRHLLRRPWPPVDAPANAARAAEHARCVKAGYFYCSVAPSSSRPIIGRWSWRAPGV